MKNLSGIRVLILGDESGAIRAMAEVDKRAGRLSTSLQRTGKMMVGLGAGVLTAIGAGTLAMGRNAEEIRKQSKAVGMSAEDYQRFSYAVQQSGGSAENLTRSMTVLRKASVAAMDGNASAIKLFDRLGISYKNADGSARNTKDIMLDMSDALAKGKVGPEQMAAAVQLLGKGGKELMLFLMQGKDAISALAASARGVIKEETLKKLDDLEDRVQGVKLAFIGLASEGLAILEPYFNKFISWMDRLTKKFEALSPESKKQIGQFILLGSVALIAGGGLSFLVGKITAVTMAAHGLKSIGTFLLGVNPTILMVVAGLLGIWSIASSIAGLVDKERARKGKKEITKKATARGYYTPEDKVRWAQLNEEAKGPKWGPISTMKIASQGFAEMITSPFSGIAAAATVSPPAPALKTTPSIFGGVATMPLPSLQTVSQTGQNINLNINVDTAAQAVQAMEDFLGDQGID